ncbi:DUF4397 domain-containing protein [Shewanella sp. FJAT-51649]|uniref:DUF4397 domain-containing protein n=1 Tax=Shewanella sp. FJAT-51649 TaxID=2864210 RepID=UPI001C65C702|nr:DUF4397 domain-containing protein [Shewanella sp. FJAT-51649]QYJ70906.1 DUF4397 domain-containing protein [Shewanella sp. FJAT-51649]
MLNNQLKGFAVLTFACLGVTACGGSDNKKDEDTSKTDTYVQFYNASAGSTATALKIGDKTYESVNYADTMPRFTSTPGVSAVEVMGKDASNKDISLYKEDIDLKTATDHFFVLHGDFASPSLLNINYSRTELDKQNAEADKSKMQLLIAHTAMNAPAYDAYIAKADQSFADAVMLGSVSYGEVSTPQILDTGDYKVYLAPAGTTNVSYTTASINFKTKVPYKLILRESFGASDAKISLDSVDSTTNVRNHVALESSVDFRVFNGLATHNVDVKVVSNKQEALFSNVAPFGVTAYQGAEFNDFGVSVFDHTSQAKLLDNVLITLNQDDIKTIFIYEQTTEEGSQVKAMEMKQTQTPSPYSFKFDIVSFADKSNLTLYFLKANDTIETASYKISAVNPTAPQSLVVPKGEYSIKVIAVENGTKTVVYASEMMDFNNEDNVTMVLNKDASTSFGYNLVKL